MWYLAGAHPHCRVRIFPADTLSFCLILFSHRSSMRKLHIVNMPFCSALFLKTVIKAAEVFEHLIILSRGLAPSGPLFAKVFLVFSCKLPKSACSQKFAFAKRSGAMKAPVGLLSDRTVLHSKMEGPCPDKFTLTWLDFCGNIFQQFNITYLLRVPARLPKGRSKFLTFLSLHSKPEPRPSQKGWSGSGCCVAIFIAKFSTVP